jgi:hypothetical protein
MFAQLGCVGSLLTTLLSGLSCIWMRQTYEIPSVSAECSVSRHNLVGLRCHLSLDLSFTPSPWDPDVITGLQWWEFSGSVVRVEVFLLSVFYLLVFGFHQSEVRNVRFPLGSGRWNRCPENTSHQELRGAVAVL